MATYKKEILHCWYSEEQAKAGGTAIYLIDGKEQDVSMATLGKSHSPLWDDMQYLGMGTYVRVGRNGKWNYA